MELGELSGVKKADSVNTEFKRGGPATPLFSVWRMISMSTPDSLMEDVRYLLNKFSLLDGHDLRAICRVLDLPVTNLGSSDMVEQLRDKVIGALDSYRKKPSRESERTLVLFRRSILLKSKFLERLTAVVNNSTLG